MRASDHGWWAFLFRWLHVLSGVMWIGPFWYFNYVQTPSMPKIPDEHKPAISKVIAPTALFWFRWAAMATIVTGPILALMNGYLVQALSLQKGHHAIGLGMWLGTIMWFNVWFIIWPNQKKALGIVTVAPEEKAKAPRWPAWRRASTPCSRSRCSTAWSRSRTAGCSRIPGFVDNRGPRGPVFATRHEAVESLVAGRGAAGRAHHRPDLGHRAGLRRRP